MSFAIEIAGVKFQYGEEAVLEEASLQIEAGEFVGLIGPNGGGKTTLLKLMMGFLLPAKGSIRVLGRLPEKAQTLIGYVPQVHQIDRAFPISTEELVYQGAIDSWGRLSHAAKGRAEGLLQLLDLAPHRQKAIGELSGGLAQRALLARALAGDPQVLLLDEATANVDPHSANAIYEFLDSLKGQKTIVMVTHDLKTAVERVDRIASVHRTIQSFRAAEVCEHFALGLYHTPFVGSHT